MVTLMQRRREMMKQTASEPQHQHVKVYLSDATPTTGVMKKSTGANGSVSGGAYVTAPYYEGMHIRTYLNTSWSNYKYAVLYNGSQYYAVPYTLVGSGPGYKWFEATLTGYTGITAVYINCRNSGEINSAYYEYDT